MTADTLGQQEPHDITWHCFQCCYPDSSTDAAQLHKGVPAALRGVNVMTEF